MRRLVAAGLTAGLLAFPAPAEAHPNYDYTGKCGFAAFSPVDGSSTWQGYVDVHVVATAGGLPAAVPISVDCVLYVDWQPARTVLSASGTGAAAGAATLTFDAGPDDVVMLCPHVVVAGETHTGCASGPGPQPFPPILIDLLDEVVRALNENVLMPLDEEMCPVLAAHAPGSGTVVIKEDGDLYVGDQWIWDCPPYGNGW